jgi:hypothetical protein
MLTKKYLVAKETQMELYFLSFEEKCYSGGSGG